MKFLLISLGIIAIIFLVIQLFAMRSQSNIETYPYTVIKSYDDFEIRRYEPSLFSSVQLSTGAYKEGSSRGFSILAGYIFGGNDKKEKIAMTSPVAMTMEDSMTMMFMVPKKYSRESLPQPNQSNIEFVEMPAKTMAAITFGGWADDEKIEKYKNKLIKYLDQNNIEYSSKYYFFGYNPPYEVFNRKNEVVIELNESPI